jgi:hypothetical protein
LLRGQPDLPVRNRVGIALLLSGIGFLVLALGGALESERLFWAIKPKAHKAVTA